ncbi:unnamed protein product [Cyclocybe aegerita]|uniref:C2H2-type domain-containing protein n=1 Tax=Cyclocybe aegerita TaxID=1973307 RepID=A0A8S0W6F7_CYCAE|nr:unnamed protein product [Cyclocybe aegerita]
MEPGCRKECTTPSGLQQHFQSVHQVPAALQPPSIQPTRPAQSSGLNNSLPSANHSDEDVVHPSSPHFSSRRSPRRSLSSSPIQTPRVPLHHGNSAYNPHRLTIKVHPILDGIPCDIDGFDLPPDSAPQPVPKSDDFFPFETRAEFEFAKLLYKDVEMSASNIDRLLQLLAALIKQGEVTWDSFSVQYNGSPADSDMPQPPWMDQTYEVWFHDPLKVLDNQIGNPDFKNEMDYAPKQVFHKGKHQYQDLMTGNWAWEQADKIAQDGDTHGAMFAPVILRSDKTTVSVAIGQNDYYPLYISLGNVHNSPHMVKPRVTCCADGHYRRVIYGLGPYIADYPEQALLACIMQNWCPKCTSPPDNLDAPGAVPRTHLHTDTLVNSGGVELKELWDDYHFYKLEFYIKYCV